MIEKWILDLMATMLIVLYCGTLVAVCMFIYTLVDEVIDYRSRKDENYEIEQKNDCIGYFKDSEGNYRKYY